MKAASSKTGFLSKESQWVTEAYQWICFITKRAKKGVTDVDTCNFFSFVRACAENLAWGFPPFLFVKERVRLSKENKYQQRSGQYTMLMESIDMPTTDIEKRIRNIIARPARAVTESAA